MCLPIIFYLYFDIISRDLDCQREGGGERLREIERSKGVRELKR